MKLEKYLKAITECPDEIVRWDGEGDHKIPKFRITTEFGVYDNWPILLQADFEETLFDLSERNFTFTSIRSRGKQKIASGEYDPGTVILSVENTISRRFARGEYQPGEHFKRQMEEFTIGIMLHGYLERKIPGVNPRMAKAMAINNIGRYALEKNIPLCFPESNGWDHKDDLSRIVYHP